VRWQSAAATPLLKPPVGRPETKAAWRSASRRTPYMSHLTENILELNLRLPNSSSCLRSRHPGLTRRNIAFPTMALTSSLPPRTTTSTSFALVNVSWSFTLGCSPWPVISIGGFRRGPCSPIITISWRTALSARRKICQACSGSCTRKRPNG